MHLSYTFTMFNRFLSRIFSFRYFPTFYSLRLKLKSYWLTQEKDFLFFLPLLGIVIIAFTVVIYHTVEERRTNRDLTCLALNVYHEARGEPKAGQYAVARVTMNRVASSRYPATVCEVVYQKKWDRIRRRYVGAFSWTELESPARLEMRTWQQAWHAAEAVYTSQESTELDSALFYHATHIKPSWARKKVQVARIGRHIFYK